MQFVHVVVGLSAAGFACGCFASAPKSAANEPPPPDGVAIANSLVAPAPTTTLDAKKNETSVPLGPNATTPNTESEAPAPDDGLGLVGTGKGGGGSGDEPVRLGAGASGQGSSGKSGRVSAATAMTAGTGLSAEVIQRVVRTHVAEIQSCYDKAVAKAPALKGRVAVKFVIDGKGAVSSASADDTTISDATMISCVLGAVKRWEFPMPDGGGAMVVTYPFNFAPSD